MHPSQPTPQTRQFVAPTQTAPPLPPLPATAIDDDARARIREYFLQQYDKRIARSRALRMSTKRRKFALGVFGTTLFLASIAAWVAGQLDVEWFRGRDALEVAVGAFALLLVLIGLLLHANEEPKALAEVEREADLARELDANRLLEKAAGLLATPDQPVTGFNMWLYGYPDATWAKDSGVVVSVRVDANGQPRISPFVVTAIRLAPSSLAVYEVIVDLTTGAMVSERLRELAYRDITTLERSNVAAAAVVPKATGAARGLAKVMRPRARGPLHDKDQLIIHFANRESVKIVLRDRSFDSALQDVKLSLSASHDAVEAFWLALRTRWHQANAKA